MTDPRTSSSSFSVGCQEPIMTRSDIIRVPKEGTMNDISVLIGGKAGDGINSAGLTIAHLFNHLGYRVYMYFDYPSLIKGGHNFAIVRASENKIGTHRESVDFILALNNDTLTSHTGMMKPGTEIVYDAANATKGTGTPVAVSEILTAEKAPPIMGNSAIIGAFAKTAGIQMERRGRCLQAPPAERDRKKSICGTKCL